jgi:hypothetical protein
MDFQRDCVARNGVATLVFEWRTERLLSLGLSEDRARVIALFHTENHAIEQLVDRDALSTSRPRLPPSHRGPALTDQGALARVAS